MIQKSINLTINTKPYDNFKLYTHKEFTLYPGLNSLVGCNGSGKSTLIDMYVKPYVKKNNIEYIYWNDRVNGGSHLMQKLLYYSDMSGLCSMVVSSEGERIAYGLLDIFRNIGKGFRACRGKDFIIMFDAIDSGMSVDEIIETRSVILDIVIPDAESLNVTPYFVIAANNYEWCADPRIHNIEIQTGKIVNINSYEDYRNIIIKSRERKNKMRGIE